MKRSAVPALWGAVALLAPIGCASSPPEAEAAGPFTPPLAPALELAFEPARTVVDRAFLRGLVALKFQDYDRARGEIGRVAEACADEAIGGRALLTLAAVELDPRNPSGDLSRARELMERYFHLPGKPAWTEPLAETLYLLGLDLVAATPEEDAVEGEDGSEGMPAAEHAADVAVWQGRADFAPTPEECAASTGDIRGGALQPPNLPRLPLVEQLAELSRSRDSLQASVEGLESEVAELHQELQRIRETLRP